MKTLFSLICLTFLTLNTSLQAAPANVRASIIKAQDRNNLIRIRVMNEVPQVQLDVQGSYVLMNPETNSSDIRIHGKSAILQPLSTGLKWGEEFPDLHQIKVIPTHPNTIIRLNGRPYTGIVTFYDTKNVLGVVNDLYVEDYIAEMLARSLTGNEPAEAINALAIAARSTARYQMQHPRNTYWDINGETVGYPGPAGASSLPTTMNAVQQALYATRYMMLTDPTGALNDAFYAPWSNGQENDPKKPVLTVQAAVDAANKGLHAAQILHATFPTAILQRITPQ